MFEERRKGEWETTIPKRIAEFFLQNENNPVSLAELFIVIYPDESVSDKGTAKLYQHMGKARKMLRKMGRFIADPRMHGSKYVLEKDPEGILKQTLTGEVRANNGVDIMSCGEMALMEDDATRRYGIAVAKSLGQFVMRLTESYIKRMLPTPKDIDKPVVNSDTPAPLLNPPTQ
jgi:hypothetical protein